jgi:hypothetical protein
MARREGEIDVGELDFLDGSFEFARFWSEPQGEQTFIIEPRALGADPFLFGMAMVDAIRHGAIAYSRSERQRGAGLRPDHGGVPGGARKPDRRSEAVA